MNAQGQTVLEKVRYLHQLGVPKQKIANDLGVHRNTVAGWLDGKHVPSQDLKEEAADARTSSGKSPTTERCDGDSQESTSARSA